MRLVLELHQTRRQAPQAGGREGLQRLRVGDAEVVFARDDHDGRVPLGHELVGRVGVGALRHGVLRVPVGASVVVVDEEELLRLAVHRLEVEDAAVGDEGLEALLVAAGQIVDRVAAVGGAHAAHALAVDPRLARHVVDGREVVADVLPRVVARDLVEPLLAERGQAAAVGRHDDVALRGHQLEVPAVAPRLRDDALRAALAVEQRGVLLRRVEVGGQDDPYEHLLAVGGRHPALLHLAQPDGVVDPPVDRGELLHRAVGGVDCEELGGHRDARHLGGDAPLGHREGVDVVVALGDDLHLAVVKRHAADLVRGLDRRHEPQPLVALPDDVVGVVVEILRQIAHLGRAAVVDEQPRLVGLVARAALREEGDMAVVGRPDGVLVVADHLGQIHRGFALLRLPARERLADVLRAARGDVVDEDVRVGRHGVGRARERLAGVGQHRAGVVPGDLGHVEIGGQGRVVGGALQDVRAARHQAVAQLGDEDVAVVALVPVVPVAGHQVVVDARLRLGKVGMHVARAAVGGVDLLHPPDAPSVGAHAEAFDLARTLAVAGPGDLPRVRAVGIHAPYLRRAAAVREEPDRRAVGAPARGAAVRRLVGQAPCGLRLEVLHPEGRRAAVLRHVVVGLLVDERAPVGRERRRARAAHLPHHLGRKPPGGDLFGRERIVDFAGRRLPVARRDPHSCDSHKQDDFFHIR